MYRGYIGKMEKRELLYGLGLRAYLWLAGNEGMELNIETTINGIYIYIWTAIRIHSFIAS